MELYVGPRFGDLLTLGALTFLPFWYAALQSWLVSRLWPRPPRARASARATYGGSGLHSWGAGTTSS